MQRDDELLREPERKTKKKTNKIRLEDWTERHFIRCFGHVVTPEYKEFLARYF